MLTSIVMPTCGKAARLKYALEYLFHATRSTLDCELVLVEQGGRDGWARVSACPRPIPVRYVHADAPLGPARARMLGVEHARGDHLVFLDDDMLVPVGFVEAHRRLHRERPEAVIHGRILTYRACKFMVDPDTGELAAEFVRSALRKDRRPVRERMTLPFSMPPDEGFARALSEAREDHIERQVRLLVRPQGSEIEGPLRWIACTTGNLALSRALLGEVGGFWEGFGRLWGLEDLELGYRLVRDLGIPFLYGEACTAIHLAHARADGTAQFLAALELFAERHPADRGAARALRVLLADRTADARSLGAAWARREAGEGDDGAA